MDGGAWAAGAQQPDGTDVLALPKGRHLVEVAGSGRAALVLDLMSIVSSSLIVAFGAVACMLMIALYIITAFVAESR